jgi:hypothetical protein
MRQPTTDIKPIRMAAEALEEAEEASKEEAASKAEEEVVTKEEVAIKEEEPLATNITNTIIKISPQSDLQAPLELKLRIATQQVLQDHHRATGSGTIIDSRKAKSAG